MRTLPASVMVKEYVQRGGAETPNPYRRPDAVAKSLGKVREVLGANIGRSFLLDFWRIVVAILLPPLGVFLQVGLTKHFWINILLTILGYIPGIVHAVWVIAKY
jgi:uncharacterized membrane protein YqaE (UPF0057 family)